MGLLRLVNAARLAPLEEILAELEGGASDRPASSASQTRPPATQQMPPAAFAATASPGFTQGVPQASTNVRMQSTAVPRPELLHLPQRLQCRLPQRGL